MKSPVITLSVVSHRQAGLAARLLEDLVALRRDDLEVIYTANVPEAVPVETAAPFVTLVRNEAPQGFARNHNAAFARARGAYFCVVNPDIRMEQDPFPVLLGLLEAIPRTAAVAPAIVEADSRPADHARRFPTLLSLAAKALRRGHRLEYGSPQEPYAPDWIAGMFMLFRSSTFREVGGFDERYFLYYEDVDICWRLRRAGYDVRVCPFVRAIHHAQRASRRQLRYMVWHAQSMLRYFRTR